MSEGDNNLVTPRIKELRPNLKKAFVLYSHPNPKSYTAALKDTILSSLENSGFETVTSDLYSMKFDPVAGSKDFLDVSNKNYFNLAMEQLAGKHSQTVQKEIDKLLWCDYLITVFPFWWSSPPAIMNGWFDRVFACGKAWGFKNVFDSGLLKGKYGLVVTSVGTPNEYYQPGQMARHTIKRRLFFLTHGTFGFCGMTPLEPIHLHAATKSDAERKEELIQLKQSIQNINSLPPMDYSSWK